MTRAQRVAAVLALSLFLPRSARSELPRPAPLDRVFVEEHVGALLPLEIELTSSSGARVRLGDVLGNGKPALLVLAYNRCSMLCNLVLRAVADFARESGERPGERFSIVTLGIDPRESPHEARRTQTTALERAGYANERWRWTFLLGGQSSIERITQTLGFHYRFDPRTEQYAHPAVVLAISPRGEVLRYFYGLKLDASEVHAALSAEIVAPREETATDGVLGCFRFEALASRYGGLIQRSFQIGALLILTAVIALIVLSQRRRRMADE